MTDKQVMQNRLDVKFARLRLSQVIMLISEQNFKALMYVLSMYKFFLYYPRIFFFVMLKERS